MCVWCNVQTWHTHLTDTFFCKVFTQKSTVNYDIFSSYFTLIAHVCLMSCVVPICGSHVWFPYVAHICVWCILKCLRVFEVMWGANVCLLSCVVPMCVWSHLWCPCVFDVICGAHVWHQCVVPMCVWSHGWCPYVLSINWAVGQCSQVCAV